MSDLSDLRRRVRQVIQDVRQKGAERRAARDEAAKAWALALEQTATPLLRDMSQVLHVEGQMQVRLETPEGRVRLVRYPDEYIEIELDTSDERDAPEVIGRTVRKRGRVGVTVIEESLGPPSDITTDRLTAFLLKAIAPFVK